MKAKIRTTITQISADCKITPKSSIFFFRNDSWETVLINGSPLPALGTYGISGVDFFEPGKTIEQNTQYAISFPESPNQNEYVNSLQLVEVFIEFS